MRKMLLALVAAVLCQPALAQDRSLEAELDGGAHAAIRIEVKVGRLELARSTDGRVHVQVTLEPDGGFMRSDRRIVEALQRAELKQRASGRTLEFEIDLPSELDADDVEEQWTVMVPEDYAVEVRLDVGGMSIRDVTGGVDVRAGVGEIDIDVPSGDIRGYVSVGDIGATTFTESYGRIRLEASVGDVSVNLRGARIRGERGYGPGADLAVDGEGEDEIDLSVSVGDARLTIRD